MGLAARGFSTKRHLHCNAAGLRTATNSPCLLHVCIQSADVHYDQHHAFGKH